MDNEAVGEATASDVKAAFDGITEGLKAAGMKKVDDYARRILQGESPATMGIPQAWLPTVKDRCDQLRAEAARANQEALMQQLKEQYSQPSDAKMIEYVMRIDSGEDPKIVMQGLPEVWIRRVVEIYRTLQSLRGGK